MRKAHDELSPLKSIEFAFWLSRYCKTLITCRMVSPDFEYGRVYMWELVAEKVKEITLPLMF